MHVHRQGCRSRSPRQPALLLTYLAESQTQTAEFPRHRGQEVLRCPQLLQVLEEEPILLVVCGSTLGAVVYQIVGQNELGHLAPPPSCESSEPHRFGTVGGDGRLCSIA